MPRNRTRWPRARFLKTSRAAMDRSKCRSLSAQNGGTRGLARSCSAQGDTTRTRSCFHPVLMFNPHFGCSEGNIPAQRPVDPRFVEFGAGLFRSVLACNASHPRELSKRARQEKWPTRNIVRNRARGPFGRLSCDYSLQRFRCPGNCQRSQGGIKSERSC